MTGSPSQETGLQLFTSVAGERAWIDVSVYDSPCVLTERSAVDAELL